MTFVHTTLELVACIMITLRYCLDIAGVFENYDYSQPAAVAFCILLYNPNLAVLSMNGGTACLVVITLDRYWKIVHAIHHRQYYRRWMMYVGLFLPWLNGVATQFIPAVSTTRIVNGICVTTAFRTKVLYVQCHLSAFVGQTPRLGVRPVEIMLQHHSNATLKTFQEDSPIKQIRSDSNNNRYIH